MTTISTAIRFTRIGLAASLLGTVLLIASAQPGAAGEIAPTPVSTMPSQAQSAAPSADERTRANSTQDMCPGGTVGFGWG